MTLLLLMRVRAGSATGCRWCMANSVQSSARHVHDSRMHCNHACVAWTLCLIDTRVGLCCSVCCPVGSGASLTWTSG
jgi:hypothetical protein